LTLALGERERRGRKRHHHQRGIDALLVDAKERLALWWRQRGFSK
jgi:hypothetical protein